MKKVTIPTNEGIDWSKPQWVISEKYGIVVLTTGEHDDIIFTGTALPCNSYCNGSYSATWEKLSFKRLDTDIPFTISNSKE